MAWTYTDNQYIRSGRCYEILGIAPDSDEAAINKAARTLLKQYHPDRNVGNEEARSAYSRVNNAYDVLRDPEKKRAHDRNLSRVETPSIDVETQSAAKWKDNAGTDVFAFAYTAIQSGITINSSAGQFAQGGNPFMAAVVTIIDMAKTYASNEDRQKIMQTIAELRDLAVTGWTASNVKLNADSVSRPAIIRPEPQTPMLKGTRIYTDLPKLFATLSQVYTNARSQQIAVIVQRAANGVNFCVFEAGIIREIQKGITGGKEQPSRG